MEKDNAHLLSMFGDHVREIRKSKGLSQEALAEKVGIHRTYVGMIERGEKNITLLNIIKISSALDVPPHTLLTRYTNGK